MAQGRVQRGSSAFDSWGYVVQDFARAWLTYGVMAIVVAGVTHGIFHIPLWQVVDVGLALFFFFVAFAGCLALIACSLDLVGGEIVVALSRLINVLLLPLLPFGAILGFMGYGFLVDASFDKESFVYRGFVELLADSYRLLSPFSGDWLGVVTLRSDGSAPGNLSIDQAQLLFMMQVTSVAVAVFGLFLSRLRVAYVADDTLSLSPFARWR